MLAGEPYETILIDLMSLYDVSLQTFDMEGKGCGLRNQPFVDFGEMMAELGCIGFDQAPVPASRRPPAIGNIRQLNAGGVANPSTSSRLRWNG
jgi:hypothetical protein